VSHHAGLLDALFPLLKNPRMAVRKRAITALSETFFLFFPVQLAGDQFNLHLDLVGNLVNVCHEEMFDALIKRVLAELTQTSNVADAKTVVQFLEGIRSVFSPLGYPIFFYYQMFNFAVGRLVCDLESI
jgi:hypothetical protein